MASSAETRGTEAREREDDQYFLYLLLLGALLLLVLLAALLRRRKERGESRVDHPPGFAPAPRRHRG